jgi:23S rRNA G2069 N7-methylase RlmK/C1962 C5-methylase RlmI
MPAINRQADMLANRVVKNQRHLRKWARREDVDCYRLYDRDIPEIPLAIDRYGDALVVAHYRAAHRPATESQSWLQAMVNAAAGALECAPERVYLKHREPGRSRDTQGAAGQRSVVREGGHRFWVQLAGHLDTGLFVDHRLTRALVGRQAAGARVLNLFCYTGSFTVYAAAGNARETVSVDLSNTALAWARANLQLNQLDDHRHELVRADVKEFLADAQGQGRTFDIAVLDPPTFSNSKRMDGDMDLRRDHSELIADTLALLRVGGQLYFSTNSRRFSLTTPPGAAVEDLTAATTPPDFRQKRPHRCWRLTKT